MQLRNLFRAQFRNDTDAVSPVIGVILMVAITVILAAVIATFVIGLGENVSTTAPQATFSYDYEDDVSEQDSFGNDYSGSNDALLTITLESGDELTAEQLGVSGSAAYSGRQKWSDSTTDPQYNPSSSVASGDRLEIWMDDTDTISITWENSEGTDSATLGEYEGPEA